MANTMIDSMTARTKVQKFWDACLWTLWAGWILAGLLIWAPPSWSERAGLAKSSAIVQEVNSRIKLRPNRAFERRAQQFLERHVQPPNDATRKQIAVVQHKNEPITVAR